MSQPFDLAPGRYQARIAMRDRNSGRVGAVTHDFAVPPRNGLTLSSLIVTDTIEPQVQAMLGPPRAVLIVRRLFPRGATLYYQFSVFDAGRTDDGQTRVTAGHVMRRADGTIVKVLAPTALAPGEHGISRFARVSLAGIAGRGVRAASSPSATACAGRRSPWRSDLPLPRDAAQRCGTRLRRCSATVARRSPSAAALSAGSSPRSTTSRPRAQSARDTGRLDDALALYRKRGRAAAVVG